MTENNKIDIGLIKEKIAEKSAFVPDITQEMSKVVVGQDRMIAMLIVALLCDGHVLLEGVPGLAKTLTIKTLSKIINTDFQRIQFTPDLLPADLLGTTIYDSKTGEFNIKKGPIFSHLILADEINRAPAKVQSALLEAMEERQITISDQTFELKYPFLVLATQNPLEQEGTYPLPEAQVDRFLLKTIVNYPSAQEELKILERMTSFRPPEVQSIVDVTLLKEARDLVRTVYIDKKVENYIVDIICATRDPEKMGSRELADFIQYGASPRGTINLAMASKAHAFIKGRAFVTPDDVWAVIYDVLRHRVILTYEAEAESVTAEDVIRRVLELVEVP